MPRIGPVGILTVCLLGACTHLTTRDPASARFEDLRAMRAHNCALAPAADLGNDSEYQLAEVNFNRARAVDFADEFVPLKTLAAGPLRAARLEIEEDLKEYIRTGARDWAAIYTSADICGLDAAERFALLYYGEGPYNRLNKALRENSPEVTHFSSFIAVLDHALKKLRPFHGIVTRGVRLSDAQIAEYEPGRKLTWPGYSSTSLTRAFPGNVQFVIRTFSGRYVSPLSSTPTEDEILLPRGAMVVVTKHLARPDGTHRIWVNKIEGDASATGL